MRPVHLCGSTLDHRAHVCAFFNSADEKYRVLTPFILEGLEAGQKGVHTLDPRLRSEHDQRLKLAGVNIEAASQRGQLEFLDWSDTHLLGDEFSSDRTLSLFQKIAASATRGGFPLTRFVTDMGWALEAGLDANALLEYEATANRAWMQQEGPVHPVICTYDLRRFTADVVVDVMRTHPLVVVGGLLCENPFFVPPEAFLEELRGRTPTLLQKVG